MKRKEENTLILTKWHSIHTSKYIKLSNKSTKKQTFETVSTKLKRLAVFFKWYSHLPDYYTVLYLPWHVFVLLLIVLQLLLTNIWTLAMPNMYPLEIKSSLTYLMTYLLQGIKTNTFYTVTYPKWTICIQQLMVISRFNSIRNNSPDNTHVNRFYEKL